MGLSSSSLIAYVGTEETRKKLRYIGVAAGSVPIGQGLIQLLGWWFDNYTVASLLASTIIAVPLFFANRRFVWRIRYGENLQGQVLVFWVTAVFGVLLATLLTYLVENMTAGQVTLLRGTAVFLAQMLGVAIVWVGRYLIFDRWLFKISGNSLERFDAINDGTAS